MSHTDGSADPWNPELPVCDWTQHLICECEGRADLDVVPFEPQLLQNNTILVVFGSLPRLTYFGFNKNISVNLANAQGVFSLWRIEKKNWPKSFHHFAASNTVHKLWCIGQHWEKSWCHLHSSPERCGKTSLEILRSVNFSFVNILTKVHKSKSGAFSGTGPGHQLKERGTSQNDQDSIFWEHY